MREAPERSTALVARHRHEVCGDHLLRYWFETSVQSLTLFKRGVYRGATNRIRQVGCPYGFSPNGSSQSL